MVNATVVLWAMVHVHYTVVKSVIMETIVKHVRFKLFLLLFLLLSLQYRCQLRFCMFLIILLLLLHLDKDAWALTRTILMLLHDLQNAA